MSKPYQKDNTCSLFPEGNEIISFLYNYLKPRGSEKPSVALLLQYTMGEMKGQILPPLLSEYSNVITIVIFLILGAQMSLDDRAQKSPL